VQPEIYVELGGTHIGFAETWDQLDPNNFIYYKFSPCVQYKPVFNMDAEFFNLKVDPFRGLIWVCDADGNPVKKIPLVMKLEAGQTVN
jgi:hypothetical protein